MLSVSYFRSAIMAATLFATLAQTLPVSPSSPAEDEIVRTDVCNCTDIINEGADGVGYICGNTRLGPIAVVDKHPISHLLYHYNRFGQLSPGEFLTRWWNTSSGSWIWPDQNGYLLDSNGTAIKGRTILRKGTLIDRFGSENGVYVSVADSPFAQRSLPPQSLNNGKDPKLYPSDYHLYRVLQDLEVESGPIAPWFEQPGLGAQFYLGPPLVDHISELVENGRLETVDTQNAEFSRKKEC